MVKKALKNWQISKLYNAINSLSGRVEYPKCEDSKPQQPAIVVPFKFGDKAVYAIAKTMVNVTQAVNAIEITQKAAIKLVYPEGAPKNDEGGQDLSKCQDDLDRIANDTSEVDVFELDINQLKISENKLSPVLVAMLDPMLVGELS